MLLLEHMVFPDEGIPVLCTAYCDVLTRSNTALKPNAALSLSLSCVLRAASVRGFSLLSSVRSPTTFAHRFSTA